MSPVFKAQLGRLCSLVPSWPTLALCLLWAAFAWNLKTQWAVFDQYHYAYAVPVLCGFLVLRRWLETPVDSGGAEEPLRARFLGFGLIVILLLLLLPIRVVHEANPLWRLTSWAWGLILLAVTFTALWATGGSRRLRYYGPAIAFFLVAVPWPSFIEDAVVQGLMRLNATAAAEILNLAGVPALRHGNIIEVGKGVVGLEEACSGIKSLQATLMMSLFLGEYFLLSFWKRLSGVLAGFGLALFFNLVRTTLLTWVAARWGVEAISSCHDPSSIMLAVFSFGALYLIMHLFRPEDLKLRLAELKAGEYPETEPAEVSTSSDQPPTDVSQLESSPGAASEECGFSPRRSPLATTSSALVLAAYVAVAEVGAGLWYRFLEAASPPPTTWAVEWPKGQPYFAQESLSAHAIAMMRCNTGTKATWTDREQNRWLVNYLRWEPGRAGATLARCHTPEECLPASGHQFRALPGIRRLGPLEPPLPFRAYRLEDEFGPGGYVFYCRSGDRRDNEIDTDEASTRKQRLRALWNGRGNQGMSVLEIVIWGIPDEQQAQLAVDRQLREMIKPK